MKPFLTALILSLVLLSFGKEFGSRKEGWLMTLPDDWNTNALLTSLVGKTIGTGEGSVETKLTAFKRSGSQNFIILNLISFETEANLLFNANAVTDAITRDPDRLGKISRKKIKIGSLDAFRIEYRRKPDHTVIQYLTVNGGRLWSLTFVCPETISGSDKEELDRIAGSFRPDLPPAQ